MKYMHLLILFVAISLLATACAATPNDLANTPDEAGEIAGFWRGLWHGIISPVAFIVSLFSDSLSVYEVHNNGNWYNFGFLLGASITFGGSGGGAARRRS